MGAPLPCQHPLVWLSTPAELQSLLSLCPQQPGRKTEQSKMEGQQEKILYKNAPVCFLLLYLPLQQSLIKQSLTGELFPLIQLLFLLHYQTTKTLQLLLPVCTSVMYLFNPPNLRGQSQTVADSCVEITVTAGKFLFRC